MKKIASFGIGNFFIAVGFLLFCSCSKVNSVGNEHFDEDGYLLTDSLDTINFVPKLPSHLKFYVEVSGSMNGFFRPNIPTQFKADLWKVMSYYSALQSRVNILTNDGAQGMAMSLNDFKTAMNTGAFVSTASTKVPLMLQSIISDLNPDSGEVAVLVSDMKYSPVGAAAPEVLLSQYSTDVSKILGESHLAVSLICATSDYRDKNGNDLANEKSPYYYFIIGNSEQVAEMRNGISTLLEQQGHFVDNIESGFNYGSISYSFGIPNKCEQLDDEPTFIGYEDEEDGDTCTIQLKINLENYRWRLSDEQVFDSAFTVKALHGSNVKVSKVKIDTNNINDKKELKRESVATVDLKVSNMQSDSEVLEWTLELPDTEYTLFNPFFENANTENDPTKSFSVKDFVKGMFYGGLVNTKLKSNYILISKN